MRLWSLHPSYLDNDGLIACWRHGLMAREALGVPAGAQDHPQLRRFRRHARPLAAVEAYLEGIAAEADSRGLAFQGAGTARPAPSPGTRAGGAPARIPVTDGQVRFEWDHLLAELAVRSPALAVRWGAGTQPILHPLFTLVTGDVEDWETAGPPAEHGFSEDPRLRFQTGPRCP